MAKFKRRDPSFKLKVALEAAKDEKQIKQIARDYEIHPKQVTEWRDRLLESANTIFETKFNKEDRFEKKEESLLKKIGQLTVENDWLKKKLP
jgi:transposase-like protein